MSGFIVGRGDPAAGDRDPAFLQEMPRRPFESGLAHPESIFYYLRGSLLAEGKDAPAADDESHYVLRVHLYLVLDGKVK